jgi:hypothetical protein
LIPPHGGDGPLAVDHPDRQWPAASASDEYLYELDELIDLCHIYLNGGKEHGISKIEVWCTK